MTKTVIHVKKISVTPPMGLEPTTFELEVQRASIAPRGLHTKWGAQTTLKYQRPLAFHLIEHPTTTNN